MNCCRSSVSRPPRWGHCGPCWCCRTGDSRRAGHEVAPLLLTARPAEFRFVLGDQQDNARTSAPGAPKPTAPWSPPDTAAIRTPTTAARSGASSTSCVPRRSRALLRSSRPPSTPTVPSLAGDSPPPSASPSVRSSSTNSCSGSGISMASAFALAANRASTGLMIHDQPPLSPGTYLQNILLAPGIAPGTLLWRGGVPGRPRQAQARKPIQRGRLLRSPG
jgi:hypothetical protein